MSQEAAIAAVVPRPRTPYEHAVVFVAQGFGAGRARWAPGTWGSALGTGMAWALQLLDPLTHVGVRWGIVVLIALAGIPLCGEAARILGQKDPRRVVWDEIAAMQVVFLIVPVTWIWAVVGFLLFRLFDIWKPWPMERLERLEGGVGIMVDDIAAGIVSGAILTLVWARFG